MVPIAHSEEAAFLTSDHEMLTLLLDGLQSILHSTGIGPHTLQILLGCCCSKCFPQTCSLWPNDGVEHKTWKSISSKAQCPRSQLSNIQIQDSKASTQAGQSREATHHRSAADSVCKLWTAWVSRVHTVTFWSSCHSLWLIGTVVRAGPGR